MAHIFQMTEWNSNGRWVCGDVSALAAMSNAWWYPANILNITPVEYVKLLINKFNAKRIKYINNVLLFDFDTQIECRKFKNYINKLARDKNFVIY